MTTEAINNDPVAGEVLAELFQIDLRNVRALAEKGVIEKAAPNRYPLASSVRGYVAHLREGAASREHVRVGSGLAVQRERETRARADIAEMKAATARGELLPAGEVAEMWSDVLRLVRAKVLGVPPRLQQQLPTLTAHDVATIDRELRDTLSGLADDEI